MGFGLKTEKYGAAGKVTYTNSGALITAGTPILVGGRVAIANRDIATGETQELDTVDRWRARKKNETWAAGDRIGWDANGDPVGGTAGSGAWTKVVADWDAGYVGGIAEVAALAADEYGILCLNEFATDDVAVAGVAVGYKIARGQHTTVAAADTVVTGLATVVSVVASYETDPADANILVSAQVGDQAGAPAAGSIIIKTWRTDGTDPTPLAANAFAKKVNWIAVGT